METNLEQLIAKVRALPPTQLQYLSGIVDEMRAVSDTENAPPDASDGDAFFVHSMHAIMQQEDEGYDDL